MTLPVWILLASLGGLLCGALLAFALLRGRQTLAQQALEHARHLSEARLGEQLRAAEAHTQLLSAQVQALEQHRRESESAHLDQVGRIQQLETQLVHERRSAEEKLRLLEDARQQLGDQFKLLAGEILEDKSRRFSEQNQTQLGQLLDPLREHLKEFRGKVEEFQRHDAARHAALRQELEQLRQLNHQLGTEAHNLATALKGNAKQQGNWGELVLENVLDRSGLRADQDYRREVSFNTPEGRRRPDVIVDLPESRHLVIDAKVSLNAYARYVNAEDPAERSLALREHVQALRTHISSLSDRQYFDLPGLNAPEMVFMFVPIESAFAEALRAEPELFQAAIERNVLVATPTTLLTSLNIVRQLWRFESQNANAAEIVDRAAKLYKKLVSFVDSFERVGTQLQRAQDAYGQALGQLRDGRGNAIKLADDLRKLGVSTPQALPSDWSDRAALELPAPADEEDTQSDARSGK